MTSLSEKIHNSQFVITSELNPPKGTDLTELVDKTALLHPHVDAVNLTDCAGARVAMCPLAAAVQVKAAGLEPICQFTARDANRIGIQANLLGASALGINNAVFMGGDPPHIGDHPDAKPVYDILAVDMLKTAAGLNNGLDMAGNALKGATKLYLGGVVNPGADDLETELQKLDAKINAGAHFVQSQAVFNVPAFEAFMNQIHDRDVVVLAGIIPVKSVKMARFMNERIPGIDIPSHMIQAIADARDPIACSLEMAAETARGVQALCSGVHIMAIGWEQHVPSIVQQAGLR